MPTLTWRGGFAPTIRMTQLERRTRLDNVRRRETRFSKPTADAYANLTRAAAAQGFGNRITFNFTHHCRYDRPCACNMHGNFSGAVSAKTTPAHSSRNACYRNMGSQSGRTVMHQLSLCRLSIQF